MDNTRLQDRSMLVSYRFEFIPYTLNTMNISKIKRIKKQML